MDRIAAMQALIKVVETGSFSAAAVQLGVGQPSVSKLVAQLERHVGVPLLLRSSRRLMPTEAGREFFLHAKRSLEEADEADLAARGVSGAMAGVLRFTAPPTFARLHIVPALPRFLEAHPRLQVDAVLDDRRLDLIEAGVDVAFRVGRLADSNMVARRIGQSRAIVVGAPSYLDRVGRPRVPRDLENHRTLVYQAATEHNTWTFRKGSDEETVSMRYSFKATSIDGLREAAITGLGLLVMTEWVVRGPLQDGRLQEVLTDWTLPSSEMHALFPAGRRVSAKAQAFAKFVAAQIAKGT